MPLKLIVANKSYSSWSFRAWILLAHFKIPFEETVIPLDLPETHARILKHSPTGKVPALIDGPITVWESLSVIEYVAELYPQKAIWPRGKAARAHARSLAAEMHAGFQALRQHCPMNFRRPVRKIALTEAVEADVARIETAAAVLAEQRQAASQVAQAVSAVEPVIGLQLAVQRRVRVADLDLWQV